MFDSDILHYGSSWNPYYFIPLPEERTPITWTTIPQVLVYWAPFYLMAYLARKADTYLLRLLLLPIVISTAAYCTYWFRVEDPTIATVQWGRSFVTLVVVAKAIDYAFVKNGRFKVGEKELPPIGGTAKSQTTSVQGNGHAHPPTQRDSVFPQWFRDASELIFTMRGIGWDFGKGLYVPKESRSLERGPFLRTTVFSLLWNYIIIDILNSLFKLVPRVGTYRGGSIFLQELSPVPRYALSSAIHLASGFIIQYGMDICNDIATLFSVGVLGQSPEQWPPVQDRPWKATSLHEYWGKRWHQSLRQVFYVYGGCVGGWLAGSIGMVLGSFFASGMYHEVGMHMSDHRVTLFFLLQGVGIILEGLWKKATGKPVGGVAGWIWTAFFVLVIGQISTDAWAIHGLIGGLIVPDPLSVTRRVLSPAAQSLLNLWHS
ncbi:uncharacterized protein C8Q71DRAFT_599402 [Rhodofomes roseus]|uniref:Wax synthase domain-containing protein n=1 Tax=Rhodofomes roseus TaxID=34475 RepID=A0ABQ8KHS3_9APHY|nr:uncharacterized protein C8Q71DRAFT_599402 [Rhodofomes roseus]KAH9837385.1 hypothetical protein C8Q71DRAFT_599402 [Rhodofomes roseus]